MLVLWLHLRSISPTINLCRIHGKLRVTPAMAAGITNHIWPIEELIAA